jgi:hypothetical protein
MPASVAPSMVDAAPNVITCPRWDGACSLSNGKWETMLNSKHMRATAITAIAGTTPESRKGIAR